MPDKVIGESVEFRIEVEDSPKSILLVLDRKCDWAIIPWQDAFRLSEVMDQVLDDVRREFRPTSWEVTLSEQSQIQLNHHKGLVALMVEWTDRIRFTSLDAFAMVKDAIRKTSQDAHLESRGLYFQYDMKGFIRKLYNRHTNMTQHVR